MAILVFLRIISDSALLMTIGGPIAVHYGADLLKLLAVTLSVALGGALSFAIWIQNEGIKNGKKYLKFIRFLPFVIPTLLALVFGLSLAEIIPCSIIFIYAVYIAITEKYFPDAEQQKLIFKIAAGVLAGMIVILLFARGRAISYSVSIIAGLSSLMSSVLILRSLRHEAAEYARLSFQLTNIGIMAAFSGAVFLLSRKTLINAILSVLKAIYEAVAYVVLNGIILIARVLVAFFTWLKSLLGSSQPEQPQLPEQPVQIQDNSNLFDEFTEPVQTPQWLKVTFIALAVIAAIAIIYLVFRVISGRKKSVEKNTGEQRESRMRIPPSERSQKSTALNTKGVRKQYRKYLQYLKSQGINLTADMTTQDIERAAAQTAGRKSAAELRRLYLDVRYGGYASEVQDQRAKELLHMIKAEK